MRRPGKWTIEIDPTPRTRLRRKRQTETPERARTNHLIFINAIASPAPLDSPVCEFDRFLTVLLDGAESPFVDVGATRLPKLHVRIGKLFKLQHATKRLEYVTNTFSLR